MNYTGLLVAMSAAFAVSTVIVATPLLMKPPKQSVRIEKHDLEPNHIRTIPIVKRPPPEPPPQPPDPIPPKPAPTPPPLPPVVQVEQPKPYVQKPPDPEPEIELPARRHYGSGRYHHNSGDNICARTGGWKVVQGRGWRCKYR